MVCSAPVKEQRRSPRIRHELVVELHDKRGARTVQALDVARHGLFLATGGEPPRARHLVQLTVHLPDGPIKAAASVTRTLKNEDHIDGVGVQFFALSDDAKQRWDDFILDLQRSTSSEPREVQRARAAPSAGATFLVKLRSVERLKEFAATHLASGGTVLFTPVLRAPGEVVTLVVVHPKTDEEFRLPGVIHKVHEERPKRLEIYFHGITPALLNSFAAYVETGHPPRVQLDPPTQSPSVRVPFGDLDLDLDVDVFDEDTLDTDDRIWRGDATGSPGGRDGFTVPPFSVHESAPIAERAPSSSSPASSAASSAASSPASSAASSAPTGKPVDPGLRPQTYLLRCDREGSGCQAEPYAVDLGPCRGVLGLVADHVAFLSQATGRIVTAPRLASSEQQGARSAGFLIEGGRLDAAVDVATLLSAVSLAEPARDPASGAELKSTRAVERLEHAARRLKPGEAAAKSKVACADCKEGHLTVELVSV